MITFDNLKIYKTITKHGEHKNGKYKAFKKPKTETVLVYDFSHDYMDIERFIGFLVSHKMDMIESSDKYKIECEIDVNL